LWWASSPLDEQYNLNSCIL